MGSRLGVLLKTAAGWEIFYDHWAAQTIGLDIAIDGAQATIERVRRMAPMGVDDPHAWKGATWIEGTLLIDEARKLVVWAEESGLLASIRPLSSPTVLIAHHTTVRVTLNRGVNGTELIPSPYAWQTAPWSPGALTASWTILLDSVLRISWLWLVR